VHNFQDFHAHLGFWVLTGRIDRIGQAKCKKQPLVPTNKPSKLFNQFKAF
jgi:hypothetical protein